MELQIILHFTPRGDSLAGKIDVPQQMAKGLSLTNMRWETPKVHFELPAGPGVAVFDGTRIGDSIGGTFAQSGMRGTFSLLPDRQKPDSVRPTVKPPYREDEVTFASGSVMLAGTLTSPAAPGRYPALVLITGSGPQNRDEEIFGFTPFRIIADHLARRGIAVLRYDDRGVGGSTGVFGAATTKDFADDAAAALSFLRSRPEIRPEQVGVCGHSEGAIAATMIAAESKEVAFVILMAGPAVTGDRIILSQIETLARAGGATDDQVREALAQQTSVVHAVKTGEGLEAVRASLRAQMHKSLAAMPEEQRKAMTDSLIDRRVEMQLQAATSPWFKFFITYDPAPALAKISCPVLAFFGERDMQVPVSLNREPMEQAFRSAKNSDVSIRVIPEANHLFQKSATGLPSEYGELKKEFVPGFLDAFSGWIQIHTRR
jgi:hypothetical protein